MSEPSWLESKRGYVPCDMPFWVRAPSVDAPYALWVGFGRKGVNAYRSWNEENPEFKYPSGFRRDTFASVFIRSGV